MSSAVFKGEKLVGRSNYLEWLTNANLFFEINGYMPYIDGSEISPDRGLYYKTEKEPYSPELAVRYSEKLGEFTRNNKRALGAIKSTISLENSERFKDKINAKELYDAIKSTFGESSLELIGRYFDRISEANYKSFNSMDEYTSQIQSSAIYLSELKNELPKPILAWVLFKGLPSSFDSFVSRKYEEIARDINYVDISKLISDLISEESRMNSTPDLEANKANKSFKSNSKKQAFCKHCKLKGHLEEKCWKKYPELRPKKEASKDASKDKSKRNQGTDKGLMSVVKSKPDLSLKSGELGLNSVELSPNINFATSKPSNRIIVDSGASEHYSPNKDWFINYKEVKNKSIIVANGQRIPIRGIGNIPIIGDNRELLITNVNYIPEIKTTLLSPRELAKKGWETLFKGQLGSVIHPSLKVSLKVLNIYCITVRREGSILLLSRGYKG